jgi:hypothetical protein
MRYELTDHEWTATTQYCRKSRAACRPAHFMTKVRRTRSSTQRIAVTPASDKPSYPRPASPCHMADLWIGAASASDQARRNVSFAGGRKKVGELQDSRCEI